MDDAELQRMIDDVRLRAQENRDDQHEGRADDGFEIARALLTVLGRRLGVGFVLDVQREVAIRADEWSRDDDPQWRADAVEIAKVAEAGYFADLIEELLEGGPSGIA